MIEKGANVNNKNCIRETCLFVASFTGYLEICELLIKKGADIELTNIDGWTPLYRAS